MSGRIKEACFSTLSNDYDPQQSTLENYGATTHSTTIAVVSRPNDTGIMQVCDEHMPELGMPEQYLNYFFKMRSDYRMNGAIDNPHNRAYEEMNLDKLYREYIEESEAAQRAIDELVERIHEGEKITLVCFEQGHKHCHRHALLDIIDSRVNPKYDFKNYITQ